MDFFIGGIIIFGGNFAIRSWAMCEGQLLPISQNSALFSLLGTIYGGDGRTTFALPDLRGRTPIGFGTGPGLPSYQQGQHVGLPTHTMTAKNLAEHTHDASVSSLTVAGTINVTDAAADENDPDGAYLAKTAGPHRIYSQTREGTSTLAADALTVSGTGGTVTVDPAGASKSFSMMQPSIAMNYIICLQGIFPSRN